MGATLLALLSRGLWVQTRQNVSCSAAFFNQSVEAALVLRLFLDLRVCCWWSQMITAILTAHTWQVSSVSLRRFPGVCPHRTFLPAVAWARKAPHQNRHPGWWLQTHPSGHISKSWFCSAFHSFTSVTPYLPLPIHHITGHLVPTLRFTHPHP